ncbi:MAG: aldo/keto reductase [Alphaproteobacteria bacterium]|nr:aldo/keto reductase [Alphaproteobacteria bacterium]
MDYVTFGRTGLKVSAAGLGCGGNSRLGQGQGKSEADSIAIVRKAIDLGVNLIDTAANYGTEGIVGKALKGIPRDKVVVATKATIRDGGNMCTADQVVASLDNSLRLLQTDFIDVFQLHAVPPGRYDRVMQELVPALLREKEKGKFRHLGLTETSPQDHKHETMQRVAKDPVWESVMLGFHMMHQNARQVVFPDSIANGTGTLLMFVVRNIFSQPDYLRSTVKELVEDGKLPAEMAKSDNPLGFLIHEGGASSLTDAAYRFVRHEPGVHVVLFGTGNPAHVETNIASILKPALPKADAEKLAKLFGHLEGVGLDLPDHSARR